MRFVLSETLAVNFARARPTCYEIHFKQSVFHVTIEVNSEFLLYLLNNMIIFLDFSCVYPCFKTKFSTLLN